uniref:Uncharacterized protein n=1 Tax=Arundo donax TaxID=35708 RepID=A0A0A9FPG0_ARUDO
MKTVSFSRMRGNLVVHKIQRACSLIQICC